jgi:hypothetical protein
METGRQQLLSANEMLSEDAPQRAVVAAPRTKAVTLRSVLLSLFLLPVNAYWVVQMELVRYSAHPTIISLFFNVVFILLLLALLNRWVARVAPRWALSSAEMLFVYSILAIGSCLCGHQMYQILVPMLSWPFRYQDASNQWGSLFVDKYLPKWAMVSDKRVILGYYVGNDTLYRWEYLRAWLPVALIWVGFTGALVFTMLCINAILRKQWTEYERLTYPVIQIPLQITNPQSFAPRTGLFSNRLFWIGFFLAVSMDTVNSLNVYFPAIPTILTPGRGQSYYNVADWWTQKPWNAVGWTAVAFYPFVIGMGMLMPLDFLFSCWFFFIFWKFEKIGSVALAWDADARFPYENNQAFGAYMMFCLFSLWLSRNYLIQVARCALGRPSTLDDRDEPIRYRGALLGIVVGMGILVGFSTAIGMGPWLAILFFLIYFALAVAITRMRAELGTPMHDLHFTGPDWILSETLGQHVLTPGQLTAFSLFFWFNRAYHPHPMPHQLEAFKLAEQSRSDYRKWFWAMTLFSLVAAFVAFWAILHLMYVYGARAKSAATFGPEAYDRLDTWLKAPRFGSFPATMAIVVGFSTALFLQAMRVRFAWWPFHPLAYAVSSSFGMALIWLPLFIAWVLKVIILRYGGRLGFQRSLPFFLGLIIGQFVIGSLLNIVGIVFQIPTYQFFL